MRQMMLLIAIAALVSCNSRQVESATVASQGPNGEALFKANCANCHKVDVDYNGPGLRTCCAQQSREWLYLFLTRRDQFKEDSITKTYKKKFPVSCTPFPEMNQEQVYAIYNYCIPGIM